jgi:hypothetical protein
VGSQCCAMFVDTIVDDRANIRDVEISMECMIGNVPGRVRYDSQKYCLVSLHNCYIRFVGASPQFNSLGPYRSEYRFVDEYFVF